MASKPRPRFRVSDLGFGFAVHDTRVSQEYAHLAGREKEQKSNNALKSRRVDLFPTRAQAQARADELNREDAGGARRAS